MKARTLIYAITSAALVLGSAAAFAKGPNTGQPGKQARIERSQQDFDRDRMRSRDKAIEAERDRDRIRDQDRVHAPDKAIYGEQLMSEKERKRYQKRLQKLDPGSKEYAKFMERHRNKMQERAKKQGVELGN